MTDRTPLETIIAAVLERAAGATRYGVDEYAIRALPVAEIAAELAHLWPGDGIRVYATGPDSDGDYWLHLADDATHRGAGVNLGPLMGGVMRELLTRALISEKPHD